MQDSQTAHFLHELLIRIYMYKLDADAPLTGLYATEGDDQYDALFKDVTYSKEENNLLLKGIRRIIWSARTEYHRSCDAEHCTFCACAQHERHFDFKTRTKTDLRLNDLLFAKRIVTRRTVPCVLEQRGVSQYGFTPHKVDIDIEGGALDTLVICTVHQHPDYFIHDYGLRNYAE